ncbi:hypothetical protein Dvina_37165 [Dactylosporangium vinaceum]|uniref:MftR C-terminal domain-containing protein n=1 Tax=Dactylosporangium vinaceum TaxID=53362 RepID=A0ABV5MIS3_9ACTN|nr:hypothetical protein [Dactylosporangium vinaceum]UAB93799.1 hypothetical protein Dvina_37165 [Dactylosporangium vinaceum]
MAVSPGPPARRAAWEAYTVVAGRLLTALQDPAAGPATLNVRLGVAASHIMRSASLWPEHGPMLVSAVHAAVRLLRADARDDLTDLARRIADRLYLLSAGPPRASTAPRNRAPW